MKVDLKKHPTISGLYIAKNGEFFCKLPTAIGYGGYVSVSLRNGDRVRRSTLVLEIYKGPRPIGAVARHLNGTPSDDRPSNLRWGTQKENCKDTVRHGRSTKGEKNLQAKLKKKQVTEIKARRKSGEKLKSIAADFSVSASTICDILAGRTWSEK